MASEVVELRYGNGALRERYTTVDGKVVSDHCYYVPTDPDDEVIGALDNVGANVRVFIVVHADDGDRIGARWEDADGREVDQHGSRIPERPANVPAAASLIQNEWHFMRHRGDVLIESRTWTRKGKLREEDLPDGTDRGYHGNGKLFWEGMRVRVGARRPQHGWWRTWDAKGVLRRESEFHEGTEVRRTCHRTSAEADGHEIQRSGPIDDRGEAGMWTTRDAAGATRTVALGPRVTDDTVHADYEVNDTEVGLSIDALRTLTRIPDARGLLARIRLAGREGIEPLVAYLGAGPPWRDLDEDGKWVALGRADLAQLANTLWWGALLGPTLAELAARLFAQSFPLAALDMIDAALRTGDELAWMTARVGYLRRLGRIAEADSVSDRDDPRRLGEQELTLLAAIRDAPDDDGPRLVFADVIADRYPEHAQLIVAQCNLGPAAGTERLVKAFVASVAPQLSDSLEPVRGFAHVYGVDAAKFVADPDLVYRVDPLMRELQLSYASGQVPQLAVMPALRRYEGLAFVDTYLFDGAAGHLASSPHLARLRSLGLRNTSLDDDALKPILESISYPEL